MVKTRFLNPVLLPPFQIIIVVMLHSLEVQKVAACAYLLVFVFEMRSFEGWLSGLVEILAKGLVLI